MLLGTAAVLYLGGCGLARVVSQSMLFPVPPLSYHDLPGLTLLPGTKPGEQFAAVYLPNPSASRLVILFHGNGDDLGPTMPRLQALRASGLAVLAVDYAGYGRSSGRPSEKGVYAAADAAYLHATEKLGWKPAQVVVHGVSLGGAGATWIASRQPVGGLILESAFMSAYRVVTYWPLIPGDQLKNLSRMKTVRCPVFVIHGTADNTVDVSHGRKLFAAAPEPKRCYWVEGASHNRVMSTAGDRYWQELREFYASLPLVAK